MSETNPGTRALALPEKLPALVRIIDNVLNFGAMMLPDRQGGKKMSLAARRAMIDDHLVMSPTAPGVPFVAHVRFGGENKLVGTTIRQKFSNGEPRFLDGKPLMEFCGDFDLVIRGRAELPDPRDPCKRVIREVSPAIICDGQGSMVPYVGVTDDGQRFLSGPPMACLFIRDFDRGNEQGNSRIRALPLGLGKKENILHYNDIIDRLAAQGSTKDWEKIPPIPNSLGRAVQWYQDVPPGHPINKGLLPVWRKTDERECSHDVADYWIVMRLGGKVATLARSSQPVFVQGDEVPEQVFRIVERWNSVEFTFWGLPGQMGDIQLHEFDQTSVSFDWLTIFGASMLSANPNTGTSLVRTALRDPPLTQMTAFGLLPPGGSRDLAVSTIRGLAGQIIEQVRSMMTEALQRLVLHLTSCGVSLQDELGENATPEGLASALENPAPPSDSRLVTALLTSNVAKELGINDIWSPTSWLQITSYRNSLLVIAKQAGVKPAAPSSPTQEAAKEANPPAETKSQEEEPPKRKGGVKSRKPPQAQNSA
ncbi:hypothetical protein EPN81_00445 [Patescibacteria group bacterium]|nr:MAG: hypothetical protein EPN81_00445 [Patescibacteria group bacterium]